METGTYAFISYSTQNQSHADAVRRIFTEQGIPNWMAPYDIPSGSKYAAELNKALKNCGCLVLLLSDASQNSEHVDKEVERAIAYKKPIVPIQIEELTLNDSFEYYIGNCQIIAVPEIRSDSPELQRVINGVCSFVGMAESTTTSKAAAPSDRVHLSELDVLCRAAQAGDPQAQYQLAERYFGGDGIQQDYEEAARWYRRAAEQGHADAQYRLAFCHEFGYGADQSIYDVELWCRRAAEQGHADAQYKLASYCLDPRWAEGKDTEAVLWYRRAAEQGHASAQYALAQCLETGCGVDKDPAEALKWYRKAAENGDFQAKSKLGLK